MAKKNNSSRNIDEQNVNESKNTEQKEENIVQIIMKEGKELASNDFAKFSAIVAVIFSAGLWVIKSIWYAIASGRFLVYNIDRCYINADNSNIFLEIIQMAAILIICFLVNYCHYNICILKDTSKLHLKKIGKVVKFWILEMIIIWVICLVLTHTDVMSLINEISAIEIIASIILLFICCLMINIFSIELLFEDSLKKRKAEKKADKMVDGEKDKKIVTKEQRIVDTIWTIGITVAIELVLIFFISILCEYGRNNYKVVLAQSTCETESIYNIEYSDNKKYEVYPIIYENQDCYIVTRLYYEDGKIKKDYDYQKIIEKEGQETIYISNIHSISTDN